MHENHMGSYDADSAEGYNFNDLSNNMDLNNQNHMNDENGSLNMDANVLVDSDLD
jgi:hypothetical protein